MLSSYEPSHEDSLLKLVKTKIALEMASGTASGGNTARLTQLDFGPVKPIPDF